MYKSEYVHRVYLSIAGDKKNRGEHLGHAMRIMRGQTESSWIDTYYDYVILSRPDVIPLNPAHTLAMVEDPKTVVFPFKCEPPAWNRWRCIADIIISLPGNFFFTSFRRQCLQHTGCFGAADLPYVEHEGFPNRTYHHKMNYVGQSGHGCLVCMEEMDESIRPSFKYLLGDDYHNEVNARNFWNPVFTLNTG